MDNKCHCRNGLSGCLIGEDQLVGELSLPEGGNYKPYDGRYEVIPKAYEDQTLPTSGKSLEDDIIVRKVPRTDTRNTYGTTVYIAKEANYNG